MLGHIPYCASLLPIQLSAQSAFFFTHGRVSMALKRYSLQMKVRLATRLAPNTHFNYHSKGSVKATVSCWCPSVSWPHAYWSEVRHQHSAPIISWGPYPCASHHCPYACTDLGNLPLFWILDIRVNKQAVHLWVNVLHGDLETIKAACLCYLDLLSEALHLVLSIQNAIKPMFEQKEIFTDRREPLNSLDFHSQCRHLQQRMPTREKWNSARRLLRTPSAGGPWRDQPTEGEKGQVSIMAPKHKGILRSYRSGPITRYKPLRLSRKRPQPSCTSAKCHGTEWGRWQSGMGFPSAEALPLHRQR